MGGIGVVHEDLEGPVLAQGCHEPCAQERLKALINKGLGRPGDAERHLGRYTANYGK